MELTVDENDLLDLLESCLPGRENRNHYARFDGPYHSGFNDDIAQVQWVLHIAPRKGYEGAVEPVEDDRA